MTRQTADVSGTHAAASVLAAPPVSSTRVWDYRARRGREDSPLADRRGARGRATAIRHAILTARRSGASIEEALQQAIAAGIPPHQESLF